MTTTESSPSVKIETKDLTGMIPTLEDTKSAEIPEFMEYAWTEVIGGFISRTKEFTLNIIYMEFSIRDPEERKRVRGIVEKFLNNGYLKYGVGNVYQRGDK